MPSFDTVSELDGHEITNAVDQANREVEQRFDFRGTGARFDREAKEPFVITLKAQAEVQLKQMLDILSLRLSKRGIDVNCMEVKDVDTNLGGARQNVVLKHGIDKDNGREIVKKLKESGLKVQAQIQGDKVRVTGKKRDDLQAAMALLRKAGLGVPLQFQNFRDD
ncbi:MAG TPA: YajQ family cyclic di-GMP-binding protein [Steroidobacteraceae bacterium]|nr:YajQ family cyclic di-GMP-binding protein [Steroidobacteraceae bacterium]